MKKYNQLLNDPILLKKQIEIAKKYLKKCSDQEIKEALSKIKIPFYLFRKLVDFKKDDIEFIEATFCLIIFCEIANIHF